MIFDNNETALYLCRRLYQFFVYPEIDAAAESQVIEPLANILRTNDYVSKACTGGPIQECSLS